MERELRDLYVLHDSPSSATEEGDFVAISLEPSPHSYDIACVRV